jgi:eukaryotic-like serine/threonine-protein kinase
MSRRRSTLSHNQRLTLLIAIIAIIATIIAAFISSHDWFTTPLSQSIPTVTNSHPTLSVLASPTETVVPTDTANPTLIAMLDAASTPNPSFVPQFRTVDEIEQAWIPEGSFVAGDISGVGYDDERPIHLVSINGFWIDRTLVTNSQYAKCPEQICTAPQKLDSHKRPNGYYGVPTYKDYPVINVTWQQASDYCSWREGRLPTEAEFEKAAGWNPTTGLTSIYPWGSFAPTDQLANYNGVDRDTTQVGSYPRGMSSTGAYDMAGNVWEWVSDWYNGTYYTDNQDWNNPSGPGSGAEKVVRGGSWYSSETLWLRVSNRGKSIPDKVANEFGFRCVFEK